MKHETVPTQNIDNRKYISKNRVAARHLYLHPENMFLKFYVKGYLFHQL